MTGWFERVFSDLKRNKTFRTEKQLTTRHSENTGSPNQNRRKLKTRKLTKPVNSLTTAHSTMVIKIATLNLCLGLSNKKTLIKQITLEEKIDVLCLQETDLAANLDSNLLSFPGYCYESEVNTYRARVGIYVNARINFVRRTDLEGTNSHLIIIDIKGLQDVRIINIYRCFNPVNQTPREFFRYQLGLIKIAYNTNCILMGDMNLDWGKKWLAS